MRLSTTQAVSIHDGITANQCIIYTKREEYLIMCIKVLMAERGKESKSYFIYGIHTSQTLY